MATVRPLRVPLLPRLGTLADSSVIGNKDLVRFILEHADRYEWTVQGLGMLRMYLDKAQTLRLHIWHPQARVRGASELHTHPWSFHSLVVAGVVRNWRYDVFTDDQVLPNPSALHESYMRQRIHCGVGGGLMDEEHPEAVLLRKQPMETYGEGQVYWQDSTEVHRSAPLPGTVTVIRREFGEDRDHAYVYWPEGQQWETAEPRQVFEDELDFVVSYTLHEWFDAD